MSIAWSFGRTCRRARIGLDVTQEQLGTAVGVSRGYIANIEAGRANVTVEVMQRIGDVLGLSLDLVATPPRFISERHRQDLVHARCVGSIRRRLEARGWRVKCEVDVSEGRFHGWIDLVAFHAERSTLLIIEVKTLLDDVGAMQRQLGWYETHFGSAVARFGWVPRRVAVWLVCLSSAEIDAVLASHRHVMKADFPDRARDMLAVVRDAHPAAGRGLAMVDPSSHRRDWLLATRIDGRRSPPAYAGYAEAARRLETARPRP